MSTLPYITVDHDQGSREWLDWRHNGIGASDAPALMGESKWRDADQLFREKVGRRKPTFQNEAMRRGHRLEPHARRHYVSESGVVVEPICLQSTERQWLRASLDGISVADSRVVEIKCGDSVYRQVANSGNVPGYYYGQLQQILAVTGFDQIDFWCWLPELPGLLVPVDRDDDYIAELLDVGDAFWADVLEARSEPALG
jgi:putative phage-type endonuclease